ncbi:hypothetical protein DFH11DRAFT_1657067 [Phellopilus nigrolimitatus]|nr:hypothetical protein DFH11DRAFT_1657067 [Phellopilus nigrolimitatus]
MSRDAAYALGAAALRSVPTVLLGVLLNVLDGVSYGMIMFPANAVFPAFSGVSVLMFFVTYYRPGAHRTRAARVLVWHKQLRRREQEHDDRGRAFFRWFSAPQYE